MHAPLAAGISSTHKSTALESIIMLAAEGAEVVPADVQQPLESFCKAVEGAAAVFAATNFACARSLAAFNKG